MSLITRCPACNTLFKVVADQLRISDGWVRCGRCEEVFDASLYLQPAPQTSVSTEVQTSLTEEPPAYRVEPEADHDSSLNLIFPDTVQIAPEIGLDFSPQGGAEAQPDAEPEVALDEPPTTADVPEATLSGLATGGAEPEPDFSQHLADAMAQREAPTLDLSAPLGSPESVLPPMASDAGGVSFMQSSTKGLKTRPHWLKPLQWVSCVALVLLLGGQVLRHLRDGIASALPSTRPALEVLCGLMQCEVQAPRRIEAVVIESSSFTKVQGDFYRLQLTLRNTAQLAVAAPSLELSLTDFHDQPMVRRVMTTKELNTLPAELAPGADHAIDLSLQWMTTGPSDRVTGYRLVAFYP